MSNYDEHPRVYNGQYEVEITIDRPVREVWRQFLDIGSWVTSHDIELVAGSKDAVGGITKVSFRKAKEIGMPEPHHHYCKIIKLIPERQYVLKTYHEKGGSYGWEIVAFDDTRLFDTGGKTRITFNLLIEMKSDIVIEDRPSIDQAMETSRQGMQRNLANLKSLVESK